jgi:hypothetical protein
MKAFRFRLDPALRWRDTQFRLEQEGTARAAGHLTATQAALIATHTELRAGSAELVTAGSAAFESWGSYVDRCRRKIRLQEEQLREARKALATQTQKMMEAHRKLRILENLRREDRAGWEKELGRETEALAGEAFLARMVRDRHGTVESRR